MNPSNAANTAVAQSSPATNTALSQFARLVRAGLLLLAILGAAPNAYAICPVDGCVSPPPIAQSQTVETFENQSVAITLHATGGPISYFIDAGPTFGSLSSISGAHVTYTPNLGYVGQDSFTFSAANLTDFGNSARVTINVAGVPEPNAWALLVIGLAGLGVARKRARTRNR